VAPDALVKEADGACYAAKASGRGVVHVVAEASEPDEPQRAIA
jgi:hypothetical protein